MSLKFIVCLFAATAFVSFVCTVCVRRLMLVLGVMDVPTERKRHCHPIAYEGGLAMFVALLVGLCLTYWRQPEFVFDYHLFIAIVIGAAATVCLGVSDDLLDLKPWFKLLAQFGIGGWMYYNGFTIEKVTNPFGGELVLWPIVGLVCSMLWYGLLINAVNMIDGLDGLAAGVVGISALVLAAVAWDLNQPIGIILGVLISASCFGFLPLNFNPAKIFMGDAGSMLLGFALATQTMLSSSKSPALLALLVPMLAVGLPLFDLVFSFMRRLIAGKHPFTPDRRHLHHRFMAAGFSQRRTVLIFYYLTAFLGLVAYMVQKMAPIATFAILALVLIGSYILIGSLRYLENKQTSQNQ